MVPPIHLGAWSMALMLWLPFELLLLLSIIILSYVYYRLTPGSEAVYIGYTRSCLLYHPRAEPEEDSVNS